MTERRLVEREVVDAEHERVAKLLRELPRRATSAPSRLESEWREVEHRAAAPRSAPVTRLVLAAVASAAIGSAATFVIMKPLLARPAAPAPVAWRASPGAELRQEPGLLRLESGRLTGLPAVQPTRCATAFGEAAWSNARFLLETSRERMVLSVESGEVEWRDARGTQRLVAGQTLELPPSVLELPAQLREAPAGGTDCASGDRACLAQRSAENDLDAENALFELAMLERDTQHLQALEHLREYQRRFPRGVFAAEARVSCVVTLARLGRRAEAAAEVALFRREHPADVLLPAVELIARQLEVRP